MSYKFTASINKEGRWYVARAIELGVVSQGQTIERAEKNLEEAVALYLEDEPKMKKLISRRSSLVTTLEVKV